MTEKRQWFQGNDIDTRIRLARALETGESHDLLMDKIYVGQAALRLITGFATLKEVATVMADLVVSCENEVRECTSQLLMLDDPSTQAARELHFQARVAAAIVSHLNQLVRDAETAADTLNHQGQPQ